MTKRALDTAEEFILKMALRTDLISDAPSVLSVGLYNDAVDDITATSSLGDITTEPTDGNYARLSATLNNADVVISDSGGNWQVELTEDGTDLTFDCTDTTGSVDACFVIANFTSVEQSTVSNVDVLIFTIPLSQAYNLANVTELNVNDARVSLNGVAS